MNTCVISLNLTHKNETLREIFQNKDFRVGLSHAINRQEIIDAVYVGQGEPTQIGPRSDTPWFNETLTTQFTEYDVDLANEFLDKVLPDKNSDGFLTPQELNPKGSPLGARARGIPQRDAIPNPGNLSGFNGRKGESFQVNVTGRTTGPVWGTGTYTTDSDLATVAVHAGLLQDGEAGVITVSIVESPNGFTGTTANGVTSRDWGAYPAGYTVR